MLVTSLNRSRIVPAFLSFVLLGASALKAYDLVTGPVAQDGLLSSRWFLIGLVEFELALGLWLLLGAYPKQARLAALAAFAGFCLVSLYQALSGASSCDCFGKVPIKPWYTMLFDLAAVAVLWRWTPKRTRSHSLCLVATWLLFLLAGIPAAIAMSSYRPALLTAQGEIVGDSPTVVLEPETWSGQPFPLLTHVNVGERLHRGSWIVLLYRHDCPVCREEISRYAKLAREAVDQPAAPRLALIEMPPYGAEAVSPEFACLRGRLSEARDWFVEAPVIVRLQDGIVTSVRASPKKSPMAQAPSMTDGNAINDISAGKLFREWRELLSPTEPSHPIRGFPDYRRARRDRFLSQIACGPLSLIAVLRHLEVPLTEEDTERILAAAGMKGTNLLQLKELAESHGLSALGVEVRPAKLTQMGLPAIVHLNGVGFAAAVGYESEGIRLVYAMRPPRLISKEEFTKAFGELGHALLLSKKTLSPSRLGIGQARARSVRNGPALRLGQSAITVGCIHVQDWRTSLTLHNEGTEPLRIKEVKPSCSCMTATVEQDTVSPGQSTTLQVNERSNRPGGFTHTIALLTNQSEQPVAKVPVRGFVEPPVFLEQPAVMLEKMIPNQPAQAEVPLGLAQDITLDSVRIGIPKGAPLAATAIRAIDGSPRLRVSWPGSASSGWYSYEIEVSSKSVSGAPAANLFVAIQVVAPIEVFPSGLLIRDEELAGEWSRTLTCVFNDKTELDSTMLWSNPEFADAIRVETEQGSDGRMRLVLSGRKRGVMRRLAGGRADLVVRFPGQRKVTIPVFVGQASFGKRGGEVARD